MMQSEDGTQHSGGGDQHPPDTPPSLHPAPPPMEGPLETSPHASWVAHTPTPEQQHPSTTSTSAASGRLGPIQEQEMLSGVSPVPRSTFSGIDAKPQQRDTPPGIGEAPNPTAVSPGHQSGPRGNPPAHTVLMGPDHTAPDTGDATLQWEAGGAPWEAASSERGEGSTPRARSPSVRPLLKKVNVTLPSDGFVWLKYGEKQLVHPSRTRAYFKCAQSRVCKCPAKKQVDLEADPAQDKGHKLPATVYLQDHNHAPDPGNKGEQHICPISVPEPSMQVDERASPAAGASVGLVEAQSAQGVVEAQLTQRQSLGGAGRAPSQESRDLLDQYRTFLAEQSRRDRTFLAEQSRSKAAPRSTSLGHAQVRAASQDAGREQQRRHTQQGTLSQASGPRLPQAGPGCHVQHPAAGLSEQTSQTSLTRESQQGGPSSLSGLQTLPLPEHLVLPDQEMHLPQEDLARRFFASLTAPGQGSQWPSRSVGFVAAPTAQVVRDSSLEQVPGTCWSVMPAIGGALQQPVALAGHKRELPAGPGEERRGGKKHQRSTSDSAVGLLSIEHFGPTQRVEDLGSRVRAASESSSLVTETGALAIHGNLRGDLHTEVTSPARQREGDRGDERSSSRPRRLNRGASIRFIISGNTLVRQDQTEPSVDSQFISLAASVPQVRGPALQQGTSAAQRLVKIDPSYHQGHFAQHQGLNASAQPDTWPQDPGHFPTPQPEGLGGEGGSEQWGQRNDQATGQVYPGTWAPDVVPLGSAEQLQTLAKPALSPFRQLTLQSLAATAPREQAPEAGPHGTFSPSMHAFRSAHAELGAGMHAPSSELPPATWTVLGPHQRPRVTRNKFHLSSLTRAPGADVGGAPTGSAGGEETVEALLHQLQMHQQQQQHMALEQVYLDQEECVVDSRNPAADTRLSLEQQALLGEIGGRTIAEFWVGGGTDPYAGLQEQGVVGRGGHSLVTVPQEPPASGPMIRGDGGQVEAVDPLSLLGGGDTLRTRDVLEDPFRGPRE